MQLSSSVYSALVLCAEGSKDKINQSISSLTCKGRRRTDGEVLGCIDSQEVATTTLESSGFLLLARRAQNSSSRSSNAASPSDALWRSHATEYMRQLRSLGHRVFISFVWVLMKTVRALDGVSVSVGPRPLLLEVMEVGLQRANAEEGRAKLKEAEGWRGKGGMIHASVEGRAMCMASSMRSTGGDLDFELRRPLGLGPVFVMMRRGKRELPAWAAAPFRPRRCCRRLILCGVCSGG